MPTKHVIRAALPLATGRLQSVHPTITDMYTTSAAAEPQQPMDIPRLSRQTQPNRSLRLPSLLPKQQEHGRSVKNRLDRPSVPSIENPEDATALAIRRHSREVSTKLRQTRATLHEIRPRHKKRLQLPTTSTSAPKLLQCAHVYSDRLRRKRPESIVSAVDGARDAKRRSVQHAEWDNLMHPWQRAAMKNGRKGMKGVRTEKKAQPSVQKSTRVQQPILIEESLLAQRKDTLQARSEPRKHTQSAWDWGEWARDIDTTQTNAGVALCSSKTADQSQKVAVDEEDDDDDMWWPSSRGITESTCAEFLPRTGQNVHLAKLSRDGDKAAQKEARDSGRQQNFPTRSIDLPALLADSCMVVHDAGCHTRQHAIVAQTLGSLGHPASFKEKNEVQRSAQKYNEDDFNCENHASRSGPPDSNDAHIVCKDMDTETDKNFFVAKTQSDAEWRSSSIKEAYLIPPVPAIEDNLST